MFVSIYFWLVRVAALFNRKARKLVDGQKTVFQELEAKLEPSAQYIWFHAASVGEFEQGRPLIERLKAERPDRKIILTFFSPSGYEMRKNYPLADIVAYLPFATRKNARRFVEMVRPEKAIFIKYEFWPNYLKCLQQHNVPVYSIAAIFNPKQAFFRWYGGSYRKCLRCFTHLFVQDEASARLLARYRIGNTTVCGDPRFDRVVAIAAEAKEFPLVQKFVQDSPVLVAGSTWPADEELLVRYYHERRNFKLILVPHEIHAEHLNRIFQMLEGRYIRYTEATPQNLSSADCLIVDTMGMLSSLYRYATIAYVGGGFGVGIHNTVEAAVFGVPVVFGPEYRKFREAHGLAACGGGFPVKNYRTLAETLDGLFANPADAGRKAGEYVQSERGATDRLMHDIFEN